MVVTRNLMTWARRLFLALPFAFALTLTILVALDSRIGLSHQHIVGYGFLFSTPWSWLLDRLSWNFNNRVADTLLGYALFLWIPALLYSACLWLLFLAFAICRRRHVHGSDSR
jgi:hypothetical protein